MRKPTTKKRKNTVTLHPAALANASIGRTHWGWSFLQYPFIGDPRWLSSHAMLPFKLFCSAMYKGGCDTLLKKWKYSGVWVSTCAPVPVSSEDRSDTHRKPTVRQALCSGHYNINSKSKRQGETPWYVQVRMYPYVNTYSTPKVSIFIHNLQLYFLYYQA